MSSSLPKYVRSENSFIIFSNCIPNVDICAKVYGYECCPDNAGFVQLCKQNQRIGFQPSGERFLTGCEEFDEDCNVVKETLYVDNQHPPLKYLATSSRFVIFTDDVSHKEIANSILSDFVIQSAGFIYFEEINGMITAKCFGESEEMHLKTRAIDSLIINDAFGLDVKLAA